MTRPTPAAGGHRRAQTWLLAAVLAAVAPPGLAGGAVLAWRWSDSARLREIRAEWDAVARERTSLSLDRLAADTRASIEAVRADRPAPAAAPADPRERELAARADELEAEHARVRRRHEWLFALGEPLPHAP